MVTKARGQLIVSYEIIDALANSCFVFFTPLQLLPDFFFSELTGMENVFLFSVPDEPVLLI